MNKNIQASNKSLKLAVMTKNGKILTKISEDNKSLTLLGTMNGNYQSSREKLVELEDLLGGYYGFSIHDSWFIIDNVFSSQNNLYHEQFMVYATDERMMRRFAAKNQDMIIYDLTNISGNMTDPVLKRFITRSPFVDYQINKNNW